MFLKNLQHLPQEKIFYNLLLHFSSLFSKSSFSRDKAVKRIAKNTQVNKIIAKILPLLVLLKVFK